MARVEVSQDMSRIAKDIMKRAFMAQTIRTIVAIGIDQSGIMAGKSIIRCQPTTDTFPIVIEHILKGHIAATTPRGSL